MTIRRVRDKITDIIPWNLSRAEKPIEIIFFSFFGVFLAVIIDVAESIGGDTSRFHRIRDALKNLFPVLFPNITLGHLITILILFAFTLIFCFLFDANSKRNSFALGAGILSIIFNINKVDNMSISTVIDSPNHEISRFASLSSEQFLLSQLPQPDLSSQITLEGKDGGERANITVRGEEGLIYNTLTIDANEFRISVPRAGRYQIIVEVQGYKIKDQWVEIPESQDISIELFESNTPLRFQRLMRGLSR